METVIKKYRLIPKNIYNWDEKNFLLGIANIIQRIMAREALESGRISHATQDGSREFLSLFACVAADGIALPPALIYKGEAFQNNWLEDVNLNDEAFFATTANE